MKTVSAKQVKEMLDAEESFHLVNVLPNERFVEKHIPGSINVPVSADGFLHRIEHVIDDKSKDKVVVYCADKSCNASPDAARKLEEVGFENVLDFEGGVDAWEKAGYPLEGSAVTRS